MKMVSGSGISRSSRTTGEPATLAPQLAPVAFGVWNMSENADGRASGYARMHAEAAGL